MDAISKFFETSNVSYLTVPVAFAYAFFPHSYAAGLVQKKFDIATPRNFISVAAASEEIDKKTCQRAARAEAASANGFETLGFYAAAVVAANTTGVARSLVNQLALSWVATRTLYLFTYIHLQEDRRFAPLRSLAWLANIGIANALFVLAARASASA